MVDYSEVQELVALMADKDYENCDERVLDEYCYEALGIEDGVEGLQKIIDKLIKFTPMWKSYLTGKIYQGFIVHEESGVMRSIIKQEVK